MAEKNDDIKQLFSHLGLNPNDYQEIRSAPMANATVSEAPRRWSLLQSAGPAKPLTPAATLAKAAAVNQVQTGSPASALPAALFAVAQDIMRVEGATPKPPAPVVRDAPPTLEPAPAVLPAALSAVFAGQPALDGLQSLFQSVREPQTSAVMPKESLRASAQLRTDEVHQMPSLGLTPAERGVALNEREASMSAAALPPRLLLPQHAADNEPETRYSPPPAPAPSRLGPVPAPVRAPVPVPVAVMVSAPVPVPVPIRIPVPSPVPAPVVAASGIGAGRLKFSHAAPEQASAHGESLQDVFRRLSRDNAA